MAISANHTLVFTDLDGTLLDHDTYSFSDAIPTLDILNKKNIPIIINSSKTFDEIIEIREQLKIKDPFIVENGAAIFFELDYFDVIPDHVIEYENHYVLELSKPIQYWNEIFKDIEFQINTKLERFSTMTPQRVSELTGLSLIESSKAKKRLYSDPIYFDGEESDLKFLLEMLENMGCHVLVGGRFIHVTNGCNKGVALKEMVNVFKINNQLDYSTIALGDSNNDLAMLEIADTSIVISNRNKTPLVVKKAVNTFTSTLFGPAGWNEILGPIIQTDYL
ncbi:HAD-IIB family hydrolase [Marinicellulosiphila megalodicopiae]|uniref:HAD-IIB family hydrolase n=1 Tax=Marinicellulosiphila megalodicopiae TaxID=2724896 RepID=UPI003BAE45EA